MKITWYGHACFRIENEHVSIVTDPYNTRSGLPTLEAPADVVIRSSPDDPAHSNIDLVPGSPMLVEALDLAVSGRLGSARGVEIETSLVSEGYDRESPRPNAMYAFELDGVRVLHMGDLGNPFSEQHFDRFKDKVDVMLALAGGTPTIDINDLVDGIERIAPRIVIPMHYDIPKRQSGPPLLAVDELASRYPADMVVWSDSNEIELTPDTLPASTQLIVLQPA